MLKIKLQRVGRKHDPSYRVVVTDRRTGPKSNKHVAIVGNYDNIRKAVNLKADEIKDWISKGAEPTETVHNILVKEKIIEGKKINVLPKKSPVVVEEKIATEKDATEEKVATRETEENASSEEVTTEDSEEENKEEVETTTEEIVEEKKEEVEEETEEKKEVA